MAYLIRNDYKGLIQTDNLSQIIGSDYSLLTIAENAAQKKIVEHLVQKYDTVKEFTNTNAWAYATTYKAKNRIYLDATTYSASATYALHALTTYAGNVYINISAITVAEAWNANHWTLLGAQYAMFYVTLPNEEWDYYTEYAAGDIVWYNDKNYTATQLNTGYAPDANSAQWGTGTSYSVTSGTLPTDTNKWTAGDNRNENIVEAMVDLILFSLHSRIAPRNIPELRYERRDRVLAWLKDCAKGDWVTLAIPRIQPRAGMRARFGSRLPKQNNNV